MSEVTVITPTIPGREEMLEECKRSVGSQTRPPARHIVYLDKDRKGIQHSMNELWPQVTTSWMQCLADDDLLLPDHLELLEPYMADADIVHSYCTVEGRKGFNPNYRAEDTNYWMTATALMRTEMVRALGGWSMTDFPEDHYFWLKASVNGYRFAIQDQKSTWIYRFHGANLTFQ